MMPDDRHDEGEEKQMFGDERTRQREEEEEKEGPMGWLARAGPEARDVEMTGKRLK